MATLSEVLLGAAWLMLAIGLYLIASARSRRTRPTLAERLAPYQPAERSIADEAQAWLRDGDRP